MNYSTIAVALWALNNTAVSPSLELVVDDTGDVDGVLDVIAGLEDDIELVVDEDAGLEVAPEVDVAVELADVTEVDEAAEDDDDEDPTVELLLLLPPLPEIVGS